jgi:hypothetical protein
MGKCVPLIDGGSQNHGTSLTGGSKQLTELVFTLNWGS